MPDQSHLDFKLIYQEKLTKKQNLACQLGTSVCFWSFVIPKCVIFKRETIKYCLFYRPGF